jgi:FtsP/CotA-like multicopper oxidase with cupredoxin domain
MKKYPLQSSMLSFSFGRDWWFGPAMSRRRFLIASGSLATIAVLPISALVASDGRRLDGRRLRIIEERRSKNGLLDTSLEMQLASNEIGPGFIVHTRTYEGTIPGPTLRVKRGDTLRIRLQVDPTLPPEGEHLVDDVNIPHGFNITNLHTHGLNVSPRFELDENGIIVKSSDHVFLEIPAGGVSEDFFYEYKIPEDHPDGTYWYHPHKHGSVAFQFMGGMAGALIIEGPTDKFLKKRGIKEQLLVLQQIRVNEDGVVQLEHFNDFVEMPHYTVNGQLKPIIHIKAGEVQRWRFIHAGMAEHIPLDISLELRGLSKEARRAFPQLAGRSIALPELEQTLMVMQTRAGEDEVIKFAGEEPQTFHLLAGDGITLPALEPVEQIFMASGNRIDALVKIDKPGMYFLIKPERDQGFLEGPVPKELIAVVLVDSQRKDMALPQDQLPSPYNSTLTPIEDDELDPRVPDPQRPGEFLPHRVLTFGAEFPPGFDPTGMDPNAPVKFPRFTMGGRYELDQDDKVVPKVLGDEPGFPPDVPPHLIPLPFDPDRVDHVIRHGAVEEWTVLNFTPLDHPFHLHQTPIFVTEVVDPRNPPPSGNTITNPNKWQDVQLVPGGVINLDTFEVIAAGSMTFRVRFVGDIATSLKEGDEPVGDYVLHCHMLDHEDLGMMQRVRVLPRPEST